MRRPKKCKHNNAPNRQWKKFCKLQHKLGTHPFLSPAKALIDGKVVGLVFSFSVNSPTTGQKVHVIGDRE